MKKEQNGNKQIVLDVGAIDELVTLTKGYSGADLKNLSVEAAMIPLRSIMCIETVDINQIRPTGLQDFKDALLNCKASVNGQ